MSEDCAFHGSNAREVKTEDLWLVIANIVLYVVTLTIIIKVTKFDMLISENRTIVNVVYRDFDLYFQAQTFKP